MRASSRVRSRSTAAPAGVHLPVRVIAWRSRPDDETPAALAFERHASSSSGETRAWTRQVRSGARRLDLRLPSGESPLAIDRAGLASILLL